MAGRILCLEGPSAVGKTTLAAALARACGAEVLDELSGGPPPGEDAALWFVDQNVARWHRARDLANSVPFVVLDSDPFKGLWYNWIFANDGWPSVEVTASLYRERVRLGKLAFPDLYVLLCATEMQLRHRKADDSTRTRRSFEKHLALVEPQRKYFEALADAAPGQVLFLETAEQDALVPAVYDAVTTLEPVVRDEPQMLATRISWVLAQQTSWT